MAKYALLTNVERARRHLTTDLNCPLCASEDENSLHVLRDCEIARGVWQKLVPGSEWQRFNGVDRITWLRDNLTKKMGGYDDWEWPILFAVTTSLLWFHRNKFVFEG